MDVVERLTLEAAQAETMLACEHRHRYAFAAPLCAGLRVLDLCCGSGYGTAILAGEAAEVVGVDNDAATVDTAQATVARERANVSFELSDAVARLRDGISERFDVVVCFEGLEHLHDLDEALSLLCEFAERGGKIVASVPNGKLFREQNPFHVTDFGYDEALAAFAPFPGAVLIPQFLAEGSLICPPGATQSEVTLSLEDRDDIEYANHYVCCVNFPAEVVQGAHHGKLQLNASPLYNRWAEGMKQALSSLRRENARLARARLGKAGSAASAALAKLEDLEEAVAGWQGRCRLAEQRVSDLKAELARLGDAGPQAVIRGVSASAAVSPEPEPESQLSELAAVGNGDGQYQDEDQDPNSWAHRRRRAADVLIPWIEQTVPLAGKTVLEYGCGNAAVSCAFAERAGHVIGVDIDERWIREGEERVRDAGLGNVQLELHPLSTIIDAVAARRGQVDVFLLYAVLEHLTVQERLEVLRLARDVVKPDGAIVVCETPNRLIYFDHHTAQMPFFHLLPDELAARYYVRSPRAEFRSAIEDAAGRSAQEALEAIARWGRGVSFHEFELTFGDLSRHVIGSNYDPLLFGERPVQPDEVILARYLDRWRPDLAPVWSRYWLDLILSPQPVAKRPPFLRPWTAETIESHNVGWTRSEKLFLGGADAALRVNLPCPTTRLVLGTAAAGGRLSLQIAGDGLGTPQRAIVSAGPGETVFTSFQLPGPCQRIVVSADAASEVLFVGYEY